MVDEKLISELDNIVKKLRHCEINSSTEALFTSLDVLNQLVSTASSYEELREVLCLTIPKILRARPASAMISNAFREILYVISREVSRNSSVETIKERISRKTSEIKRLVQNSLRLAARIGARRVSDKDIILTNSYSKSLLLLFEECVKLGKDITVYIAESRPGFEGLNMAEELDKMGIPTVVFVDSAVRYFMKEVRKVFVSAEAVAANGAVVNKIGTSLIALAAHEARVRVFVLAITYKFNPETLLGELIEVPQREPAEVIPENLVKYLGKLPKAAFPLFDVTPPEYIDAIITERGVIAPQATVLVMREIYGWPLKVKDVEELFRDVVNSLAEVSKK